ncbi:MAG: mycothiol synthase [Frankiaceae bacterium]|nr:mycothiol synthase [Frankiaceae bacterium]
MIDTRVQIVSRPTAADSAAILTLVEAATDVDGAAPLSEHVLLHLQHGGDVADEHVLIWSGERLVAYGHLDTSDRVAGASGEIVVHPEFRRHGFGSMLITTLVERSRDGRLRLWAHGAQPAAVALAQRLGFRRTRTLWQMRRSLLSPMPAPDLPAGVTIRNFEVGRDEQRWLDVNNRAFAKHPEQGRWTIDDLRMREAESWFDPAGFFLAERAGGIIAFHWTKVHGSVEHEGHEHPPIGEVYVVGVDPSAQRLGLGTAMTLVGLRYLRARGLAQVMLYVDDDNAGAIAIYESMGFIRWDSDATFTKDDPPADSSRG